MSDQNLENPAAFFWVCSVTWFGMNVNGYVSGYLEVIMLHNGYVACGYVTSEYIYISINGYVIYVAYVN